jgi:hypothetical protein
MSVRPSAAAVDLPPSGGRAAEANVTIWIDRTVHNLDTPEG